MRTNRAANRDYTLDRLPHTRREVFFDICGLYGVSLLRTGLSLLAFAVPLLICGVLRDENELSWLSILRDADDAERATACAEFQLTDSMFSLFAIAGYVIFSLGLAGAARVIRQHAWEEPVNLKLDLPTGIRQNWKPYLLLGFLTGSWIFLSRYRLETALYAGRGAILNLLPTLLGLAILLPVLGFALVNTAVYDNTFGQNLRISLFLQLKTPLTAAGILILMVLPLLLADMLPLIPARFVLRLAVIVLSPFLLLIWFLWCYDRLDAFVNPGRYPELIGRGLAREDSGDKSENGDGIINE